MKLVDAQFPPYSQVIPQSSEKKIARAPGAFSDALRAVSIAASERTGGVKLALGKGTMRITSESPESGDGFDEVPVEYAGAPITIGFNAKYFLDVLGALDGDEVILGLSGELDPAVVRPAVRRAVLGCRHADADLVRREPLFDRDASRPRSAQHLERRPRLRAALQRRLGRQRAGKDQPARGRVRRGDVEELSFVEAGRADRLRTRRPPA